MPLVGIGLIFQKFRASGVAVKICKLCCAKQLYDFWHNALREGIFRAVACLIG